MARALFIALLSLAAPTRAEQDPIDRALQRKQEDPRSSLRNLGCITHALRGKVSIVLSTADCFVIQSGTLDVSWSPGQITASGDLREWGKRGGRGTRSLAPEELRAALRTIASIAKLPAPRRCRGEGGVSTTIRWSCDEGELEGFVGSNEICQPSKARVTDVLSELALRLFPKTETTAF